MEAQLRFTRLWLPAQPVVVSVLAARIGDRVAVEDLVQEVALAAFKQLHQYDESRSFTAWVLGIAQHKAIDWLRKKGITKAGVNRGLVYWADGDDRRILFGCDHFLHAIDAAIRHVESATKEKP